jgi:carboxylesterase type B
MTLRDLRRHSSTAFAYFWTDVGKAWVLSFLNATHTAEIPFFFNSGSVFGFQFSPEEVEFAEKASDSFLSFIEGGNPGWTNNGTWIWSMKDGSHFSTTYQHEGCDKWDAILRKNSN